MSFNILFLNVGRRCELVEAFRRSLTARGPHRIVGTDISPFAPGLQVVDEALILPRGDHPDFLPALINLLRQQHIDLVIPTIDPDLVRLDKHRAEIEAAAPRARLLLAPSHAIAIARNKRLSRDVFMQAGLDVPRDLSDDPERIYPVFVKPPDGSASEGAAIVYDAEDLIARLARNPSLLVEEVVPGDEITVDVLCDFSGKPLCAVPRRRIKVRGGEVVQGVVELRTDLEAAARTAALAVRTAGPVTVQFRVSPGRVVAMELNARMGGGLPLAIAAGADWPGMIVDLCNGIVPATPQHLEDGLVMTRADRSFFLTQAELKAVVARTYKSG
jgi:carbamoyl-phosphate synthase large subunit